MVSDEDFLVNLGPLDDVSAATQADDPSPADIGWLGQIGGGLPVVVKGVLRGDDAVACREDGAAAVIVSNHGGRQLDGALPTAAALPGVAEALAAACGARPPEQTAAVSFTPTAESAPARTRSPRWRSGPGRSSSAGRCSWALACGGAEGVRALLAGLTDDLAHAMALAGVRSVAEAGVIAPPAHTE